MKIQVVSDLHQEFSRPKYAYSVLVRKVADMLIIAGDLCFVEDLEYYLETLRNRFSCIIFVPGNHDYYHRSISDANEIMNSIHIPGVHILNRKSVVIDDIQFIGATGWPDHSYKRMFTSPHEYIVSGQKTNDWNFIKDFSKTYLEEGRKDSYFIKETLRSSPYEQNIVITHFVPIPRCSNRPFHIKDFAFINDYASWLFYYPPTMWIHGHSHSFFNEVIHGVQFIRNPFGYIHISDFCPYEDQHFSVGE